MQTDVLTMLKEQLDPEEFRRLTETRQSLERRFMKLQSETNYLRILPGEPGKLWFREVHNHFKVGGPDKRGVCVCLAAERLTQSRCFIEDVISFYQKSSHAADQEYAKALRASRIYWVNAYDAKSDEPVVRIVPLSYTTFQQLFSMYLAGEHSFLDVEKGVNTIITKQAGNKYFVRLGTQKDPIASPDLLDQRFDLDEIVQQQIRSYEEQMSMFPVELVAKMKSFGLVKDSVMPADSPHSDFSFTAPITGISEERQGMGEDEINEQMEALMKVAKRSKANLEDI